MGKMKLWEVPGDDTRYMCDDGKVRTWGEMTADLEPDVYPSCKYDFNTLMFCFGAEPIPAWGGSPDGDWRGFWAGWLWLAPPLSLGGACGRPGGCLRLRCEASRRQAAG